MADMKILQMITAMSHRDQWNQLDRMILSRFDHVIQTLKDLTGMTRPVREGEVAGSKRGGTSENETRTLRIISLQMFVVSG